MGHPNWLQYQPKPKMPYTKRDPSLCPLPTMNISRLILLFTAILPLAAQTTSKTPAVTKQTDPLAVHNSAIVIDTHADTTQRMLDDDYDLTDALKGGYVNFESARKGNLGAEFFSIWVDPKTYTGHDAHRTLELIDAVYQQAAKHPQQMRMAYSPEDIVAAHSEHKLAALMGVEGGHSIENSLGLLRDYYRLGVRYMTLTWSNSNGWADSSGDIDDPAVPHTKDGLSDFGKDVVYEMNRLGMMVDISHVSDKTFYRTLIISRAPVIASHSAARALCNSPRNMDDNMLRAVGQYGGVVMVNFYSSFLSEEYRLAAKAQEPVIKQAVADAEAKLKEDGKPIPNELTEDIGKTYMAKIPRPPFSVLIDHIDHIAKIAGIDHVGLGSDFDGIPSSPQGMDSAADLPKITQALMARGYSAEDMNKILGGNFLRVFAQVQEVSKQLQSETRPRITEKQPFDKK
jgi:membrane dipeptidase